jgi:hypothetical protein
MTARAMDSQRCGRGRDLEVGLGGVHRIGGSVMRNPINIDHRHSRAISQEIGEQLHACLRVEPELPAIMRMQVDRLRELEGESPSIVPGLEHGFGNEPRKDDASRGDRS